MTKDRAAYEAAAAAYDKAGIKRDEARRAFYANKIDAAEFSRICRAHRAAQKAHDAAWSLGH
jgi:hypothetical protein